MCLVSVKEDHDDYAVPARVVRRERRRSPPRTTRVSRAYYEDAPRPQERTYIIQQQPPPPVIEYAPPSEHSDHRSHHDPPPPPPSAPASERHSHAGPQYVEVTPSSRSSSSSSSSDGSRSKTTSRSRATGSRSEYHLREKEYWRERRSPHHHAQKEEYDTYRYVQPPHSSGHRSSGNLGPRSSQVEDPRASRSSYNTREIVIESGREREYRR
ncbi:hypothetical protein KCU77_g5195, partial [Aureobasidium melanogenum]